MGILRIVDDEVDAVPRQPASGGGGSAPALAVQAGLGVLAQERHLERAAHGEGGSTGAGLEPARIGPGALEPAEGMLEAAQGGLGWSAQARVSSRLGRPPDLLEERPPRPVGSERSQEVEGEHVGGPLPDR